MEVIQKLRKILGEKLREHEPLQNYTSMHVGGVADYFYEALTIDELVGAIQAAVDADVPYFVLGGGSNVIVSDYGFPGLVIANKTSNIAFLDDKSQAIVDSGVFLGHLITQGVAHELGGLEFLVGVPGTIGGAVYNNASCWGGVLGDYVKGITVLVPPEDDQGQCQVLSVEPEWMNFNYHNSKMKELGGRQEGKKMVILSVRLQMTKLRPEEILRRIQMYQQMRVGKQPTGVFSAGSIFKNPSGEASSLQTGEDGMKQSAGYLIDAVGGKKLRVGGAGISKKHANFVVNNGKAKATEIRALIENIRELVKQKYGILLEEEVEYLGKWPTKPDE